MAATTPPGTTKLPKPVTLTRVTRYSQRDPRWGKVLLNDGPFTIAEMGCLLTCLASVLTDAGTRIKPPELNAWLIEHDGFEKQDWIKYAAVAPLGLIKLRAAEDIHQQTPLAPLARDLAAGHDVLIFVDTPPGGAIASHWVRLVDTRRWLIMDPARLPASRAIHPLHDYTTADWPLAQAVKAYVVYKH